MGNKPSDACPGSLGLDLSPCLDFGEINGEKTIRDESIVRHPIRGGLNPDLPPNPWRRELVYKKSLLSYNSTAPNICSGSVLLLATFMAK